MKTKVLYLSIKDFDNLLETDLEIVHYPNKRKRYYVCSVKGEKVHVFINSL